MPMGEHGLNVTFEKRKTRSQHEARALYTDYTLLRMGAHTWAHMVCFECAGALYGVRVEGNGKGSV